MTVVGLPAVSKQLTTESPTLQLAKLSQHRSSGLPHAQQPVLEHQLSQPPDCSQGAYPPWMLQSSNPAFCIPDSIGTQSPMHRDRQAAAPSAVQPSTSTQQQQGQTRNAAALQELMTQAQPSELDAEDFEADTGTSDAGIPNSPVDAAILDSAAQQAVEQAAEEAVDQTVEQTDGPSGSIAPMQTGGATGQTPKPGGLSEDQTDKGRGAGTPAGPQEEFYSPPEHWRPDSGHHDECSTAKLQSLAVQSGQTTLPFVSAAKVAEAVVSEPVVSTAAPVPAAAPAAEAVQGKEATGAAAQDKTPVQAFAAGQTKTPANGKHRLLNKRCVQQQNPHSGHLKA